MAKPHQRVLALVLAVLFLATSVVTGATVIWQITKDNKKEDTSASESSSQSELEQAIETPEVSKEDQLQGTKLKGFTSVAKVDELQIIDIKVGTGKQAKANSTVTAHYTGALAKDGTIFESSHDSGNPATFPLAQVIKGWQQGVPGMKVGGTRRLVIPSDLAYGPKPPQGSGIPANAPLVFDIELSAVDPKQ